LGKICRGAVLVIARDDEAESTDADDVARLELNENKSGVDDRVPMLTVEGASRWYRKQKAAAALYDTNREDPADGDNE
jgi:hypothetical protein